MLSVDNLVLFFSASLALGIAPGPDNLFVLTQAALHGARAGLWVTLGLCTGLLVHTTVVTLGVATLLATHPLAFDALRFAGAGYLLYLAWQAFSTGNSTRTTDAPRLNSYQLYRRGIIMNVTNPKVAIFFLAFLPQFVAPESGGLAGQFMLLGAVFMLATLLVFGSVAIGAGAIGQWLRQSPRAETCLHRLAGLVFIALALRLALLQL